MLAASPQRAYFLPNLWEGFARYLGQPRTTIRHELTTTMQHLCNLKKQVAFWYNNKICYLKKLKLYFTYLYLKIFFAQEKKWKKQDKLERTSEACSFQHLFLFLVRGSNNFYYNKLFIVFCVVIIYFEKYTQLILSPFKNLFS